MLSSRVHTLALTSEPDPESPLFAALIVQAPTRVRSLLCDGARFEFPDERECFPGEVVRVELPKSATESSSVTMFVETQLFGRPVVDVAHERASRRPERRAVPVAPSRLERNRRLTSMRLSAGERADLRIAPDFCGRTVGVRSKTYPTCLVCAGMKVLGVVERIPCPRCDGEGGRSGTEPRLYLTGLFVGVELAMLSCDPIPLESLNGAFLESSTFVPGIEVCAQVANLAGVPVSFSLEILCEESDESTPDRETLSALPS